jgi:hypothetical protein
LAGPLVKTTNVSEFCGTLYNGVTAKLRNWEDSCIHTAVETYILYKNRNKFEMIVENVVSSGGGGGD